MTENVNKKTRDGDQVSEKVLSVDVWISSVTENYDVRTQIVNTKVLDSGLRIVANNDDTDDQASEL